MVTKQTASEINLIEGENRVQLSVSHTVCVQFTFKKVMEEEEMGTKKPC